MISSSYMNLVILMPNLKWKIYIIPHVLSSAWKEFSLYLELSLSEHRNWLCVVAALFLTARIKRSCFYRYQLLKLYFSLQTIFKPYFIFKLIEFTSILVIETELAYDLMSTINIPADWVQETCLSPLLLSFYPTCYSEKFPNHHQAP